MASDWDLVSLNSDTEDFTHLNNSNSTSSDSSEDDWAICPLSVQDGIENISLESERDDVISALQEESKQHILGLKCKVSQLKNEIKKKNSDLKTAKKQLSLFKYKNQQPNKEKTISLTKLNERSKEPSKAKCKLNSLQDQQSKVSSRIKYLENLNGPHKQENQK